MRNENEREDNKKNSTSGNKYDRRAGLKGSGNKEYDDDLEIRQDQSNRDREEQQGKDEEG